MRTLGKIRRLLTTAALVAAIGSAATARGAVVEGSDQKPVRVQPAAAPAAASPAATTTTPTPAPGRRGAHIPPGPAAAVGAAAAADNGTVIGEKEFNSCKKFPSGKRIVSAVPALRELRFNPNEKIGEAATKALKVLDKDG